MKKQPNTTNSDGGRIRQRKKMTDTKRYCTKYRDMIQSKMLCHILLYTQVGLWSPARN